MPANRNRRSHRRIPALALAAALAASGGALGMPAALGTATAEEAYAPAADGAAITAEEQVDARTVDLTVDSPALGKKAPVRLLLPAGYDTQPDRTYAVLYLLHGADGRYTDWTDLTDVEEFVADKDVITVIPDSGPTGFATTWWSWGQNSPDYEKFQVDEVWQLLRNNYRASGDRAVAGISTGGYSAMAQAAHNPGEFGAAASYSGIVDTLNIGMPTVVAAIVLREWEIPTTLWGSSFLNRSTWQANNPTAQAEKLAGTGLYLSQGRGIGSGTDFGNLIGPIFEGTLWAQAHTFTDKLKNLGIPAEVHYYEGGSHEWPYWQDELKSSWPVLAKGLGLGS